MRFISLALTLLLTPFAVTGSVNRSAKSMCPSKLCESSFAQLTADSTTKANRKALAEGLLLTQRACISFEGDLKSRQGLVKAVHAWNKGLGLAIFAVEPNPNDANITVRLVTKIPGVPDAQGEVLSNGGLDTDGVVNAEILVADNVNGRKLTNAEVSTVIAHELGHVLGLDDSPNGEGLMGEFDPAKLVSQPSNQEILAVRTVRSWARHELG
jgi:hypothetical protein